MNVGSVFHPSPSERKDCQLHDLLPSDVKGNLTRGTAPGKTGRPLLDGMAGGPRGVCTAIGLPGPVWATRRTFGLGYAQRA